MVNKKLANRILTLSYEHKLAHLGSCLSVLPILEEIYQQKKPGDKVFLSGAHSHLAHLVVQEEYKSFKHILIKGLNQFDEPIEELLGPPSIEFLLERYGIHCDIKAGCDASGGSLGHLGIAVGMALANPKVTVYAVITDGSAMEGSEMEALRICSLMDIKNLRIHCNFNGFTAVEEVKPIYEAGKDNHFIIHNTNNMIPLLDGVQGHYLVLNDETYKQAIKEVEALP